jgi:hypothetical protein
MSKFIDLSGRQFGFLLVVEPTEHREFGSVVFKCLCTRCGSTCYKAGHAISSGQVKSCGCADRRGKSLKVSREEYLAKVKEDARIRRSLLDAAHYHENTQKATCMLYEPNRKERRHPIDECYAAVELICDDRNCTLYKPMEEKENDNEKSKDDRGEADLPIRTASEDQSVGGREVWPANRV